MYQQAYQLQHSLVKPSCETCKTCKKISFWVAPDQMQVYIQISFFFMRVQLFYKLYSSKIISVHINLCISAQVRRNNTCTEGLLGTWSEQVIFVIPRNPPDVSHDQGLCNKNQIHMQMPLYCTIQIKHAYKTQCKDNMQK